MPRPTTTHHHPPPSKIYPPPPTTTHHQPKLYPPLPTISQKMDYHPAKAKTYSYITSIRYCFNSFLFFKMQYYFPWRRFCVIDFDQFVFKFQISTTFSTFYDIYDFLKVMFNEFKFTRFILFVFINKIVMLT